MERSLAVERAEMLRIIEHLERIANGLQDENAGVSRYVDELHALRERISRTRSPTEWKVAVEIGRGLLTKIAVELMKTWL